jgi:hypothetical protein
MLRVGVAQFMPVVMFGRNKFRRLRTYCPYSPFKIAANIQSLGACPLTAKSRQGTNKKAQGKLGL